MLRLFNRLYDEAAWQRRRWYARRPDARRRLSRPVISVGALAAGGSGKTPLTAHVARTLVAMGERPAVLSRGYRRADPADGVVVVRDTEQVVGDLATAGDEPWMLAQALDGVAVVVAADRYLAGRPGRDPPRRDRASARRRVPAPPARARHGSAGRISGGPRRPRHPAWRPSARAADNRAIRRCRARRRTSRTIDHFGSRSVWGYPAASGCAARSGQSRWPCRNPGRRSLALVHGSSRWRASPVQSGSSTTSATLDSISCIPWSFATTIGTRPVTLRVFRPRPGQPGLRRSSRPRRTPSACRRGFRSSPR